MATSETINTSTWQKRCDRDFPRLCITCIYYIQYTLTIKEKNDSDCKICSRSFTVQRWRPRARMRFRKTEICRTCSELYNVCQTCLLYLEYIPSNQQFTDFELYEFYLQRVARELPGSNLDLLKNKLNEPRNLLRRLVQTAVEYKKNILHICSSWFEGECTRGKICPYHHVKPATPSEDRRIATLYIGNINTLKQQEIRDHFCQYGEIRCVSLVPSQQCALVQYTTRDAALTAVEETNNKLIVGNQPLTIKLIYTKGTMSHTILNPDAQSWPAIQEVQ